MSQQQKAVKDYDNKNPEMITESDELDYVEMKSRSSDESCSFSK